MRVVEEIEDAHQVDSALEGRQRCVCCGALWPCDAAEMVGEIRELATAVEWHKYLAATADDEIDEWMEAAKEWEGKAAALETVLGDLVDASETDDGGYGYGQAVLAARELLVLVRHE